MLNRQEANLKIDLFISDINHPGIKSDNLVERLIHWGGSHPYIPKTPTLILSMRERQATQKFLQNCVSSYLHKSYEPEIIVEVIEDLLYL